MLHIVTDGAADMPNEWVEEYGIKIVPINILFGDKSYLQFIDLDNEDFYRMVDEAHKIPKTSQPSPHQFREFYQKIANTGDTILSMHVTSKLSGTYGSAVAAARELEGKLSIIPFDSRCGSAGLGMMCREARIKERTGAAIDQILKRMEIIREKMTIALLVGHP